MSDHTAGPRGIHAPADAPEPPPEHDPRQLRRVVASSFVGSTIEFYDFLLYTSAAAVVFPKVFFAGLPDGAASAASFATLAIGFVARPVGSFWFGSIGDRIGRKRALVTTMTLMGLSSAGIGLLPGNATIGALAPILLIALRLVQGVAVGGEWGGATALSLEHAPARRRGIAVALVTTGAPVGSLLASSATGTAAALTGDGFLSWGWRIPFLLSLLLLFVGLYLRLKVVDSPVFHDAAREGRLLRRPVQHILVRYWRPLLRATIAVLPAFTIQGVIVTFALNYAVNHGVPRGQALFLLTLSSVLSVLMQVLTGTVSDRLGRRTAMLIGTVGTVVLAFPMFWTLQTATGWGLFVSFVLGHTLCQSTLVAAIGPFVGELFPTNVRTTASGAGYQLAGMLGGFAPLVGSLLFSATQSLVPVATLLLAVGLAATAAVLTERGVRTGELPS